MNYQENLRGHRRYGVATGPLSFMNPTTRQHIQDYKTNKDGKIHRDTSNSDDFLGGDDAGQVDERRNTERNVEYLWRSRDNRKGRHALVLDAAKAESAKFNWPSKTSSLQTSLEGIGRMFTTCPYWDVSYLVAIIFTIGSVVWVINSFFVWLPLVAPSTEFDGEVKYGGGITAFLGATIFEIGSIFLMIEAVNENRSECFGWAFKEAIEEGDDRLCLQPDKVHCRHHHGSRNALVFSSSSSDSLKEDVNDRRNRKSWTWFPSWFELRTHYLKEVGFLASLFQLLGASIFWIAGFTGLPGVLSQTNQGLQDGVFWTPQVVGGSGFIISATLFMLETQQKWYLPAPKILGWHIGFWNLIGALGFTLCGALGYGAEASTKVEYESNLATFWGSWAFLIGSVVQWYESLDKHPVEIGQGGGNM